MSTEAQTATRHSLEEDSKEVTPDKKAKTTSAYKEYFDKIKAFYPDGKTRTYFVNGLPDEDDEAEDDEDLPYKEDVNDYTAAEMSQLRFLAMTPTRFQALQDMHDWLIGDVFNTSFSYLIINSYEDFFPSVTVA